MAIFVLGAVLLAIAVLYLARGRGRSSPLIWMLSVAVALSAGLVTVLDRDRVRADAGYEERVAVLAERDPRALTGPERLALLKNIALRRPDDAQAQRFLGDEFARAGRWFEAARSYERELRLAPSSRAWLDFGDAAVRLNDGVVTRPAREAYRAALELDPAAHEAEWRLAYGLYQDGEVDAAGRAWAALFARMPAGRARDALAIQAGEVMATPRSGPDADAPIAITPDDMAAFADAMIARVETRLARNPKDLADWCAVVFARARLGDRDAAEDALQRASAAFDLDDPEAVFINALMAAFGVESVTSSE